MYDTADVEFKKLNLKAKVKTINIFAEWSEDIKGYLLSIDNKEIVVCLYVQDGRCPLLFGCLDGDAYLDRYEQEDGGLTAEQSDDVEQFIINMNKIISLNVYSK